LQKYNATALADMLSLFRVDENLDLSTNSTSSFLRELRQQFCALFQKSTWQIH